MTGTLHTLPPPGRPRRGRAPERVWLLEVTAAGEKDPHHTSRCVGDEALDLAMRPHEKDPSNRIRVKLA